MSGCIEPAFDEHPTTLPNFTLSPGEQRYLILEYKVGIFEDLVHEDDEFAHDGSESDFGGFAGGAQTEIKYFEVGVAAGGDQGGHVKSPAHGWSASSDSSPPFPTTALAGVRRQSGQGGDLTSIERTQFGQFGEYTQSRNGADARDGLEFLRSLMEQWVLLAESLKFFFDLLQICFQTTQQAFSLTAQAGEEELLGLLPLRHEQFQQLSAAANQFAQLLFHCRASRRGLGLQGPAISREHGGIDAIGFGALALSPGKVPNPGWIQNADGNASLLQYRDDVALVTAGGFTDDLGTGMSRQEFKEAAMAGGGLRQIVNAIHQVELQVKLGNIQARVDSGNSVLAHSCIYELAFEGRSINGSSLGHRSERFWLPTHLVKNQCQRATNSSAPLPSRLQAGRQIHLPIQLAPDKDRWKGRYKRAGVRWCSGNRGAKRPPLF